MPKRLKNRNQSICWCLHLKSLSKFYLPLSFFFWIPVKYLDLLVIQLFKTRYFFHILNVMEEKKQKTGLLWFRHLRIEGLKSIQSSL